jgi:hypothetical protein
MWKTPDKFKVKIGGNTYINCSDLIVGQRESLFQLKRREEDGLLGVDFDVYAQDGSKVATVRNGNIVQGDSEKYEIHKEGGRRYWMVERASGRIICDIKKAPGNEDGSELEIAVDLYSKNGAHFAAGPEETIIGNCKVSGCTFAGGVGIVF